MPRTPRFTITARDFRDLLAPVLPLACTDTGLPVLCSVLLESHGATITATATDRFRVGMTRHALDDEQKAPGDFRALVDVRALKLAVSMLKPTRRNTLDRLTVRVVAAGVKIAGPLPGMYGAETELTVPYVDGEFPKKVQGFLADAVGGDRDDYTPTVGLNPAYLADFRHATRDRHERMVVRMGASERKPIGVVIGDHFVGALMPRADHGESRRDPLAPWAGLLDFPTAKTEAAA